VGDGHFGRTIEAGGQGDAVRFGEGEPSPS